MSRYLVVQLFIWNVLTGAPILAGDDYYDQLERRQQQQDRDRENFSWSSDADGGSFAAIAYSPKTGKYGYSYDYSTRAAASQGALRHCPERDAQIVAWAVNSYCALAVGANGHGAGQGSTATQARAMALRECAKHSSDAKILVCVFSGN